MKKLVAKRTEKYTLIRLARGVTAIVNSKFVRAKETEDTIFLSLPPDYTINYQRTKYEPRSKKYELDSEGVFTPLELLNEIKYIRQCLKEGKELNEIFHYEFSDLPF